ASSTTCHGSSMRSPLPGRASSLPACGPAAPASPPVPTAAPPAPAVTSSRTGSGADENPGPNWLGASVAEERPGDPGATVASRWAPASGIGVRRLPSAAHHCTASRVSSRRYAVLTRTLCTATGWVPALVMLPLSRTSVPGLATVGVIASSSTWTNGSCAAAEAVVDQPTGATTARASSTAYAISSPSPVDTRRPPAPAPTPPGPGLSHRPAAGKVSDSRLQPGPRRLTCGN